MPDLDDEATNLRVAKAIELLGHPLFTATGEGIGPPKWVALGHHIGTHTGEVKLILHAPDGTGVSVTTGNEPSSDRTNEFTSSRTVELLIEETPYRLQADVDDEGGLIIQTQVSGRWLEIELRGIEPSEVQIVRIAEAG